MKSLLASLLLLTVVSLSGLSARADQSKILHLFFNSSPELATAQDMLLLIENLGVIQDVAVGSNACVVRKTVANIDAKAFGPYVGEASVTMSATCSPMTDNSTQDEAIKKAVDELQKNYPVTFMNLGGGGVTGSTGGR